jgi:menaquinol-cytochrome c reductase iron-sulfur subunit
MERMNEPRPDPPPDRRGFLKRLLASVIGGVCSLVPLGAGLAVFFDPLRRKAEAGRAVQITSLHALPADGVPRKFSVISNRTDAWNKFPATPVGAIYLRRTDETTIEAFNVICPHAGCFIDYAADMHCYLCPCHNSTFAIDGSINDPKSPSPRGMDSLEVEIRNESEVWIVFQNFRSGLVDKIPEA